MGTEVRKPGKKANANRIDRDNAPPWTDVERASSEKGRNGIGLCNARRDQCGQRERRCRDFGNGHSLRERARELFSVVVHAHDRAVSAAMWVTLDESEI